MEKDSIKKSYYTLERNVLILIAIPLPFFAFIFLSTQNGTLDFKLPDLPAFWDSFGLGLAYAFLALHYFAFQSSIKKIRAGNFELEKKMSMYSRATHLRFWALFASILLCAAGLMFFENSGYTIAFAISLVFMSLGKPSPDRIIRLLRLKGAEKELIEELKRPG
ncbi:hypothetical protein EF405_10835 [Cyclobacteriaceae bacterium YHN15]|nr:hypothetical protein EF405_10835 [Cyclobacteriaceae bacterium YHN15]